MKQIDKYPHKIKATKPDVRQTQNVGGSFNDRLKAHRISMHRHYFQAWVVCFLRHLPRQ